MDGIVTVLDDEYAAWVRDLWRTLEQQCGLYNIQQTPIPHFSWHIAESYNEDRLALALQEICKHSQPFVARTAGLGIFSGESPVIYIAIAKDRNLLEFHEKLCQRLEGVSVQPNPYYLPAIWMPHITLASEYVHAENASCVFNQLGFSKYEWRFKVDHLALIGQETAQPGQECMRYPFLGDEQRETNW